MPPPCTQSRAAKQFENLAHGVSPECPALAPAPKRRDGKVRSRSAGKCAPEPTISPAGATLARLLLSTLLLCEIALAATKPHVISFGKWTAAQWQAGSDDKPIPMKVRALLVDGHVKEYTLGVPHEITERLFAIRRAFRVNDALPDDTTPHWQWQRGGWLLVDRVTGKVSAIALPDFDGFYSAASWYRDYTAYCGIADDGQKVYAIVAQLGRRKPVLKKLLSDKGIPGEAIPDSACPAPPWQRSPPRVTFESAGAPKQTYAIRGHIVDVVNDDEEDDSEGN